MYELKIMVLAGPHNSAGGAEAGTTRLRSMDINIKALSLK